MDINLQVGLKGESKDVVTEKNTAVAYGSGGVAVYATPAMIGLMENAALSAVDPHLPEGMATVGTELNVKHLSATPMGMVVRAKAELLEVTGRRLVFNLEAYDELEKIGEGTHERYIINIEKFLKKTADKLESKK